MSLMTKSFFLIIMFLKNLVAMSNYVNNRPIIAILAQDAPPFYNRSYIAASYVKYLESSGARVVPVPSHMSDEQVEEIFHGVNGVLFPGGGVQWNISGYFKHAKYFFAKSLEANKNGDYFPIWGTCLGFQTLHVIVAGNRPDILTKFSASDLSFPLNFTDNAPKSRMFQDMPQYLYKALGTEAIAYNHHNFGVSPKTYDKEPSLRDFFNVLSYNNGERGKTFVSTVEAMEHPIYGTQWHPEKSNFEFSPNLKFPHCSTAVQVSQYMSNFFVNEARKNQHRFESIEKEREYLIYNYKPEYTAKGGPLKHFEQCYFFNDRN